jgi:hypothetical protein
VVFFLYSLLNGQHCYSYWSTLCLLKFNFSELLIVLQSCFLLKLHIIVNHRKFHASLKENISTD